MAFIGCGKCKLYYIYIFALVFFKFVSDYIEGFSEREYKDYILNKSKKESFIDFTSLFGYHPLIRNLVYFLSSLLCSLFLYIVYLKNEEDREGSISLENVSSLRSQLFGEKSNCFLYFDMILTGFIFVLNITLRTYLANLRFDAGFWTIEILFLMYLNIKILKQKIGNHQKVAIFILAGISFSLQIVNTILPKTDHECKNNAACLDENITDNNTYTFIAKKFGHAGYVPLIVFFYIIHFMMRDYSWVRLKYLLDTKSKPIFKVMLYIGIIGCSLVIICLIIVTNVPCNIKENIKKVNHVFKYIDTNEDVDFSREICGLIDYDDTKNTLTFYYDNFNIFFKDYANSNRKILEIIIMPVYFIINIIINFCYAMILKHIDPNAMLANVNFNYFIYRLVSYIIHGGNEEYLTLVEFILLELCEILAILAYMIYIELIELKFCKLDYHLKKNIEERGIEDAKLFLDEDDDDNDDCSNGPVKAKDDDVENTYELNDNNNNNNF
jgi:hypothetical protein